MIQKDTATFRGPPNWEHLNLRLSLLLISWLKVQMKDTQVIKRLTKILKEILLCQVGKVSANWKIIQSLRQWGENLYQPRVKLSVNMRICFPLKCLHIQSIPIIPCLPFKHKGINTGRMCTKNVSISPMIWMNHFTVSIVVMMMRTIFLIHLWKVNCFVANCYLAVCTVETMHLWYID